MNRRIICALVLALVAFPYSGGAQERVAFEGFPVKKVEAALSGVLETSLTAEQSRDLGVRIVERGGRYYWATRGMKELQRSESGSYITFHAIDGAGYVRIAGPSLAGLLAQLPSSDRKGETGYVEHLVVQFASVTYFGNPGG